MSTTTPVKKKLIPVIKKTAAEKVAEVMVKVATKGKHESVLVEYTPAELSALIGPDTKVMVGRKSLKLIREKEVLVKAGLR